MRFYAIKCLKVVLMGCFCCFSGLLRAECLLDDTDNVETSFHRYIKNEDCLESLVEWAFSSLPSIAIQRFEALNELMVEKLGEYPRKVYNLSSALEEEAVDRDLAVEMDEATYRGLMTYVLNWKIARALPGIMVGGGGYYVTRRVFKNIGRFNRWILPFRFNPVILVAGTVVAVVSGEAAIVAMDFAYQEYLEMNIERDLQRLRGQLAKRERGKVFRNIVEAAINIVVIERGNVFAEFHDSLIRVARMENFSEMREFFEGLVERYPLFFEENVEKDRISLLLVELESLVLTEEEREALSPLREYLVLVDSIRILSRRYTKG